MSVGIHTFQHHSSHYSPSIPTSSSSSQHRQRLGSWLKEQLDSENCPGCTWLNKELGIFRLSWKHSSKPGYNEERDAMLFRNWELHTNRYSPGDPTAVSVWKSRFRNALNRNPDIEEMENLRQVNGENAYRIYRFKLVEEEKRTTEARDKRKNDFLKADERMIIPDQTKETSIANIEQYLKDIEYSQTNNVRFENWKDIELADSLNQEYSQTNIARFESWDDNELEDVLNILRKEASINCCQMNTSGSSDQTESLISNQLPYDGVPIAAFGVKLYQSDKEVGCEVITNENGLRIAYKPPSVCPNILNKIDVEGLIPIIFGPINAQQMYYPDSDDATTQMALSKIHCGLFVKIDSNGDIYATRFCKARVYYSDNLGKVSKLLKRREQTLVFSFKTDFLSSLNAYKRGTANIPSFQVFFSFAENWTSYQEFEAIRVRCSVTHFLSQHLLKSARHEKPYEVLEVSPSDDFDRIQKGLEN